MGNASLYSQPPTIGKAGGLGREASRVLEDGLLSTVCC